MVPEEFLFLQIVMLIFLFVQITINIIIENKSNFSKIHIYIVQYMNMSYYNILDMKYLLQPKLFNNMYMPVYILTKQPPKAHTIHQI